MPASRFHSLYSPWLFPLACICLLAFLPAGCSEGEHNTPLRPNILFILSDQQHYQAWGGEDASFKTPSLDRLARESRRFSHAFVTAPQCSPSRASIYTGLYPHKTGIPGNTGSTLADGSRITGLKRGIRTAGSYFRKAGYFTGYIGKWHLGPVGDHRQDYDFAAFDTIRGGDATTDEEKTRKALEFLAQRPNNRPFALFLNYREPHNIYDYGWKHPPEPLPELAAGMSLPDSYYREDPSTKPRAQTQYMETGPVQRFLHADEIIWKSYRGYYRQRVAHFDRQLNRILAALKEHKLNESTIVLVTSDHGDMDARHRLVYKGPFMYEQLVRVPLIVRVPQAFGGQPAGIDHDLTVNVDLLPTMLEFAGLRVNGLDGSSLVPRLTGKAHDTADFVISQYQNKQKWNHPMRMIRTPGFKYVDHLEGMDELYDLRNDPEELVNLALDASSADIMHRLGDHLEQWLKQHQDPFHQLSATDPEGRPVAPRKVSQARGYRDR